MLIGIVYDLFEDYPWREGEPPDADAENEPLATLEVIEAAVQLLGHESVRLGSPLALEGRLQNAGIDVAINIAEGAHSRNREAYAPVLLEMAGVPFLGSDALGLSVTLDKAWTKDLVAAAGIPTPAYWSIGSDHATETGALPAPFPLFVKPRYEGSSKGITRKSLVTTEAELRAQVAWCKKTYEQDVIVEQFISGAEFTVAVVGSDPVRALPALQRAVDVSSGIGLHVLERRGYDGHAGGYDLPGILTPELDAELQRLALAAFRKLDCKDYARIDFRVDMDGNPWFLEINPLPTFAPDGTMAIQAELEGTSYTAFLAGLFDEGIRRVLSTSMTGRDQ